MFLKAAFKSAPVFVQVLMLFAVISSCLLFMMFLSSLLIIFKVGVSPEIIKDLQQNVLNYPDLMRGMQFLQTLGLFLLPAIICAWLFSDDYKAYIGIDGPIYLPVAFWTVISIMVALPFLNWTYFINQQMVFPEALKGLETWMKESEAAATQLIELMLNTKSIPVILFNILAICVIAGICEEFMFRGFLQTFFGKLIRNPHVLIWTIAILFSAIHFQFYGFITRMLLGAWFGYLMYYTKTIWIPVLAHFTHNFISVGMYYLFQDTPEEIKKIDAIGTGSTWWLSLVSLVLFFFCVTQIKKSITQ
jgi:membrane protease YdiL (CAAX protease family)